METEALHKLMLFENLSPEQLTWLAANSTEVDFEPNQLIFSQGEPGEALWVLIEGEWRLARTVEGVETNLITAKQPGTWAGGIPLPKGDYQSNAVALISSRMLRIPADTVEYMLNTGFPIANHLLAGLTAGARNIEAQVSQREKMAALGQLSAGLAHELNNPAAAGKRAAAQLRQTLDEMQTDLMYLTRALPSSQLELLNSLQVEAKQRAQNPPNYDPLAQSEHEDELNAWLDNHAVSDGWEISATLVGAGLDTAWLEQLTELNPTVLGYALSWLAATLTAYDLVNQLEHSHDRISELVKSIKEYSYMDQAPVQEIDVHNGLENTLTILNHKLKHGITVIREYDRSLPRIMAHGSELNQVWTNLLDNAIDAMHGQGHIWIRTSRENNCVLVEIADDGPGIPPQIQSRIFEPFFTTKGVGEGSGLGLDISYRIVTVQHKGEIKVLSQPGDTRFQVRLPITG